MGMVFSYLSQVICPCFMVQWFKTYFLPLLPCSSLLATASLINLPLTVPFFIFIKHQTQQIYRAFRRLWPLGQAWLHFPPHKCSCIPLLCYNPLSTQHKESRFFPANPWVKAPSLPVVADLGLAEPKDKVIAKYAFCWSSFKTTHWLDLIITFNNNSYYHYLLILKLFFFQIIFFTLVDEFPVCGDLVEFR